MCARDLIDRIGKLVGQVAFEKLSVQCLIPFQANMVLSENIPEILYILFQGNIGQFQSRGKRAVQTLKQVVIRVFLS